LLGQPIRSGSSISVCPSSPLFPHPSPPHANILKIAKFNDKKIDFSQAEYDMASAQHVLGIGYGQGKIHVIGAGGWKTLSNPAVKK